METFFIRQNWTPHWTALPKKNGQDGVDLFNLVTKVVLPEEVKDDLCNLSAIGFKLFTAFVKERIQIGKDNLWSPMKKTEAAHLENHKKEDQGDR